MRNRELTNHECVGEEWAQGNQKSTEATANVCNLNRLR